jgi:hypothetical protein
VANLERPAPQHNEPDHVIGTIRKNAQQDIAVSLRTYKGYRFVDLRLMASTPDGGTTPTAKGVTLKAGSVPELIGLLQRAHVAAVEAGWCDGDGA